VVADLPALRRRMESLLGVPCTERNEVRALRNGVEIFPAMLDAIRGARRSVDLLTYVYWTGWPAEAFADALSSRATDGLRVRVLIDAVGGFPMDQALVARMRSAGAQVSFFRRPWVRSPMTHNHRTHRKVMVVDGTEGFTGGVGIAQQWDGDARTPDEWRDTQVWIRGPAVSGLQAAFVQNWAETTGEIDDPDQEYPPPWQQGEHTVQVVRGSATLGWDDLQTAWYALITSATEHIRLQTAYFAPDATFVDLLTGAADRGVRVEVLLPGPHWDKTLARLASERHYGTLLDAGVCVFRFQPTMLHTKVLTVDDSVAMVGSANYDRRSMEHDEEVAALVYGGPLPRTLAAHFDGDLERSRRVSEADVTDPPLLQRVGRWATVPLRHYL
jgi:cardiolipin synthase A/B